MFTLNNDVVEGILSSSTFSDEFKDLMMQYAGRELTENEVNDFLIVLSYAILDERRIKQNLFDSFLSNSRASRLNIMLEGLRRNNRNNTLTNSEIDYIRNNLLRDFIVDDASVVRDRTENMNNEEDTSASDIVDLGTVEENSEVYGPRPLIRQNLNDFVALREELNGIKSELDSGGLSIGLNRLRNIRNELTSLHELNLDMQEGSRFNNEVDNNELREMLTSGDDIWYEVGQEMDRVNQIIDIKERYQSERTNELSTDETYINEVNRLLEIDRRHLDSLQSELSIATDPFVRDSLETSINQTNEKITNEVNLISERQANIDKIRQELELLENGGRIEGLDGAVIEERSISREDGLTDEIIYLRNRYNELVARLTGRELSDIGLDELNDIKNEFLSIELNDNRYEPGLDVNELRINLVEGKKLSDDISKQVAIIDKEIESKTALIDSNQMEIDSTSRRIRDLDNLISRLERQIDELKKRISSTADPNIKATYERMVDSLEKEIAGYKKQLDILKKELEEQEKLNSVLKTGGSYKDYLKKKNTKRKKSTKKKTTKEEEKKDEKEDSKSDEVVLPKPISRPKPSGLPADVTRMPHVKYNKPKLTWKTAMAVAAGVGIGATVFFAAGPTGVAVMSIVNSVALKVVGSARAKAAANRMSVLGGAVEVEAVEEPKKGIKGAVSNFKKYIKSEEGLRDISWMLTSAIITGNALSIGSAIRSKMIASKAAEVQPVEAPAEAPVTETPVPEAVEPTPQVVEPTPAPVTTVAQPTTPDVYSGIRLGDNVGNYNVSIGHRQATKAFGGWDPLHLNQNLVNSDSVFSEFAIVDDSGKLLQRISTPGLSLDEVCAQYGVNYSNVVLDVAKNGTPQAWISVEELVKGVSLGGPTI